MAKTQKTFKVEDAELVFTNFAGEAKKFNAKGARNFCVFLPEEVANDMRDDGWNIKTLSAQDEGDPDRYYIKVNVKFDYKPPRIVVVTSAGATPYSESMVETLDVIDMKQVDIICTGSDWQMADGSEGISAYLKTMVVIAYEDDLELKYADILAGVPMSGGVPDDYDPDE